MVPPKLDEIGIAMFARMVATLRPLCCGGYDQAEPNRPPIRPQEQRHMPFSSAIADFRRNLVVASIIGLAAATPAHASERDDIEAACRTQTFLQSADRGCVADHAAANFSESQRAWLLASVAQDHVAAMKAQSKMSQNETIEIGTFMATATQKCPR